jgi:hypothetical protein
MSSLPLVAQSYCVSPYLDKSLFSYDDRLISVAERAKPFSDMPVKFYSRAAGTVRFKLCTTVPGRATPSAATRTVKYEYVGQRDRSEPL